MRISPLSAGSAGLLSFCLCLALPIAVRAQQSLASLRPALENRIARHKGSVGLALIDLRTGDSLSINGNQPFPTASTIKLPILVELFHQVEHGKLRLEDPIIMVEADRMPGSGVLQLLSAPHQLTVRDAAVLMIGFSDNTATNLIIDKLGIRAVGARMDTLGFKTTRLHAKVFQRARTTIDTAASNKWGLGVTTPSEYARLLARVYAGDIVSKAASAQIVDMLKNQFYDWGIPRYLPPGTSVAHKTGSLDESRSDCGIVYAKSARSDPARDDSARTNDYVLCIFTNDNEDKSWRVDNAAQVLIADVARQVNEALTGTRTAVSGS